MIDSWYFPHQGHFANFSVAGRIEGRRGGTPIPAQEGWRWLRSALPFKEGKLMFFLPKHNIFREVHKRSLSPVFPCASARECAFKECVCMCVYVFMNVWPWRPHLTPPFLVQKRVGTSSWSSFKVRQELLKDTLPVNFTFLFRQRISLLTFSPFSSVVPSITKTLGIFLWQWWGSLEREKNREKGVVAHLGVNVDRQQWNPGWPEVDWLSAAFTIHLSLKCRLLFALLVISHSET